MKKETGSPAPNERIENKIQLYVSCFIYQSILINLFLRNLVESFY